MIDFGAATKGKNLANEGNVVDVIPSDKALAKKDPLNLSAAKEKFKGYKERILEIMFLNQERRA